MLIVKSKYRIAKRLGAGVFDQTQTQKFALAAERAKDNSKKRGGRGGSDFGKQLLEKQRLRFTYGLSEKQLSSYVEKANHEKDPSGTLHKMLELRADTTIYQSGLASTRRGARQMVSHGHILINGVRTTKPSHYLKKGDVLTIREGSKTSTLFAGLTEKNETRAIPSWLDMDVNTLTAKVTADPQYNPLETGHEYATVFEFYSR